MCYFLNMTTFIKYGNVSISLPKEITQHSNFTYMLVKSNLNLLQGITQKKTHICLKATGYHGKKYIQP